MSKRLRDIPETCPLLRRIEECVDDIRQSIEDRRVTDVGLDLILDYATQMRDIASVLRDTARDIAEEKNRATLAKYLYAEAHKDLEYEKNKEIERLENIIYDLKSQLDENEEWLNSYR